MAARRVTLSGRSLEATGNRRPREMIVAGRPLAGRTQNPAYRSAPVPSLRHEAALVLRFWRSCSSISFMSFEIQSVLMLTRICSASTFSVS